MSHPAAAFPFAYRLPTDVASQIRNTGPVPGTRGSSRGTLVALVLTVLVLVGGLAALLPSGTAEAMVTQECVHDLHPGSTSTDDPLLCF